MVSKGNYIYDLVNEQNNVIVPIIDDSISFAVNSYGPNGYIVLFKDSLYSVVGRNYQSIIRLKRKLLLKKSLLIKNK